MLAEESRMDWTHRLLSVKLPAFYRVRQSFPGHTPINVSPEVDSIFARAQVA
jgi:hypothetical protein